MALPRGNCLSNSINFDGIGTRGAEGMPVLKRSICGTDSSLGRESAARLRDFWRTSSHGGAIALWPHSYETYRWPIFPGARCGICAYATSQRAHPVDRNFPLPKSHVACSLLAAVV